MTEKNAWPSQKVEHAQGMEDWTSDDGEVRELTAADVARMKPFSSVPADLQHVLREIQRGNSSVRPDEERVAVRVSRAVAERFKANGAGWESEVDKALRHWLDHRAS